MSNFFYPIAVIPQVRKPVDPLDNPEYKSAYWKNIQRRRDGYEKRYYMLFRNNLNKQYKELADRIDVTNYRNENIVNLIDSESMEKLLKSLYTTVGVAFASYQSGKLKSQYTGILKKAEEDMTDEWYEYIMNYIKTRAGLKITSINEETKRQALKIIRAILDISTEEGWGADETARAIRKKLLSEGTVINQWRALRIARTEVMTASNQGSLIGAQATNLPMEKYWIATYDNRTRDTHLVVEQQNPKNMDEGFRVGAYMMECPGDPDAGPEEVINCRCALAFKVKDI